MPDPHDFPGGDLPPELAQMAQLIERQMQQVAPPETVHSTFDVKVGRRVTDNAPTLTIVTPFEVLHFPFSTEGVVQLRTEMAEKWGSGLVAVQGDAGD